MLLYLFNNSHKYEVIGSAFKSSEGFKIYKILRIKLNKIRKLKGVKNALYLFNNIHKY